MAACFTCRLAWTWGVFACTRSLLEELMLRDPSTGAPVRCAVIECPVDGQTVVKSRNNNVSTAPHQVANQAQQCVRPK
jgi:hypothetical protein